MAGSALAGRPRLHLCPPVRDGAPLRVLCRRDLWTGMGNRWRSYLAELKRRALLARYQVDDVNHPSIGLARAVGMTQFLTLTHYVHSGDQASYPKSAGPGA